MLIDTVQKLRKLRNETAPEPITGPYTSGAELRDSKGDDTKTFGNVLTSALTMASLEDLSANHAAIPEEMEFITGLNPNKPNNPDNPDNPDNPNYRST